MVRNYYALFFLVTTLMGVSVFQLRTMSRPEPELARGLASIDDGATLWNAWMPHGKFAD
jgi:hypothetical protein